MAADWALLRAYDEIFFPNTEVPDAVKLETVKRTLHGITFAQYIERHEDVPVDPMVIEAREIVAKAVEPDSGSAASEFRAGRRDHTPAFNATLTALRRGIEIGRTPS